MIKQQFSPEQEALRTHIQAANAKTREWIAVDPANRIAGIVCEDPAHWATYDITTVAAYELSMALVAYADAYKSYYSRFPRLDGFTSVEQVRSAIARIF